MHGQGHFCGMVLATELALVIPNQLAFTFMAKEIGPIESLLTAIADQKLVHALLVRVQRGPSVVSLHAVLRGSKTK